MASEDPLTPSQARIQADCLDDQNASTKVGQLIGNAFEAVVIDAIKHHLLDKHPAYLLLEPGEDGRQIRLEMAGGLSRQVDNVIGPVDSDDPVALLETKWLKDARHHNDKGAWILQLREVRKNYPTVRGSVAILAGYWTSGVGVMLMNEGGVRMVIVASDEQVYSTLQPEVDSLLGEKSFVLDAGKMRKRYIPPDDLRRAMCHLYATSKLNDIAKTWLEFEREDEHGNVRNGLRLIHDALVELLSPLPDNPRVEKFEIALQIDTGNTIYQEFADFEEAQEFLRTYFGDPQEILRTITPRKKSSDND